MGVYENLVRPILFRLDTERVHNLALGLFSTGLVGDWRYEHSVLEQVLFGQKFPNPIGLAAGFDKNGVALPHWHHLGFGFVEIGTVTYLPQPGNPKPRLFRLPSDAAVINRMGFNNDGAEKVAKRITGVHSRIPYGLNLGKSRLTDVSDAPEDYRSSYRLMADLGDYLVVNVSSPNTPGLRGLQEKKKLEEILWAVRSVDATKPVFVKVSPDLNPGELDDVLDVAFTTKLAGLIATNTTVSREGLSQDPAQEGGLSGRPLFNRSNDVLAYLARGAAGKLVMIGVGGIFSATDAYEKIALGADLCQLYTGWVYGGPQTVSRICRGLAERMRREGIRGIQELKGSALRLS